MLLGFAGRDALTGSTTCVFPQRMTVMRGSPTLRCSDPVRTRHVARLGLRTPAGTGTDVPRIE